MDLWTTLNTVAARFSGEFALWAQRLSPPGPPVAFGAVDKPQEAASTLKLWILGAAAEHLSQNPHEAARPLHLDQRDQTDGSGILKDLEPPMQLSWVNALTLMIAISDNSAANLLIRHLGVDHINRHLARWGFTESRLLGRLDFQRPGPLALTCARELAQYLRRLWIGADFSDDQAARVRQILARQQFKTLAIRQLPYRLWDTQGGTAAPDLIIASKSGARVGVRNEAAWVHAPWGDYVYALMSWNCRDPRFHPDNEAERLLPWVTRALFAHYAPDGVNARAQRSGSNPTNT
jgi:beta-lactamase class A